MRYSFKAWGQETDWPTLRDIWIAADREGFWDMVWLNDHLIPPKADEGLPLLESWSLLAGLAAVTERLRFGTMVSSNTFRHPGVLAKTVATIDQMSGGRLEIGLGAGWHEREHESYGVPLPPVGERFDRLEETLASCTDCSPRTSSASRDPTTGWSRHGVNPNRSKRLGLPS